MANRIDLSVAPKIQLQEAKAELDQGTALFVDLRKPEHYDRSHIPGAITIPLRDLFRVARTLPLARTVILY